MPTPIYVHQEQEPPQIKCEYTVREMGNYRCVTKQEYESKIHGDQLTGGVIIGALVAIILAVVAYSVYEQIY